MERVHQRIARRSPREASRSGSRPTPLEGARNTCRIGRFTSPPRRREGFDRGSSQRPRSPGSAPHCAARCSVRRPAPPSGDGCAGASRLARKHVSFRRLQKLDSGRHGAASRGCAITGGSRTTRARSTARPTASAGGGESRARSRRGQPARRTTGRHGFSNVSNHAEARSKWCGDELDPTVSTDAERRASFLVRSSTVLPRKGWLPRREPAATKQR